MQCLVESEWFSRMTKGNNYRGYLAGFGQNEKEKGSPKDVKASDEEFKKLMGQDLLVAMDRDLNGQLNFNEYMMIRKGVIAWLYCVETTMNRQSMKCGLSIMSRDRVPIQSEADSV